MNAQPVRQRIAAPALPANVPNDQTEVRELPPHSTVDSYGYIPTFDETLTVSDDRPETYSHEYPNSPYSNAYGADTLESGYYGAETDYPVYQGNSFTYPESSYEYYNYPDRHWGGPYQRERWWDDGDYSFEADWPLFSRHFDTERAELKTGPIYWDLVSAEVGVLYSDYDGPARFAPGEEDGFLGFAGVRLRAAAKIAPSTYFILDGEIIYLFGDGELGLRSSGGIGNPFAKFEYRTDCGPWDVRIYDIVGTYLPFDLRTGDGAYERAGRYSFGFLGYENGRNDILFDPVVYNRFGVEATRLVNPDWRFTAVADHTDYFYLDSDRQDDHASREHIGLSYEAEPGRIPFSPYARYDGYSDDYFDSMFHTFYVGGRGRLSQRVTADGRIGYFWGTGDNVTDDSRFLWELGFRHDISERTYHGVRFGQGYFFSDFTDDSVLSEYFHYYFSHEFTERLRFYGFAQWSSDEFVSGALDGDSYDTEIYGARLYYKVCENVTADTGYRFEERENEATGEVREREIFDVNVDARIGPRTNCYFRYQFEQDDFFDEDLYLAGVRRYF